MNTRRTTSKVLFHLVLKTPNIIYSLSGETRLDDRETNELLCLPKPRKTQRFERIRNYMYKMHVSRPPQHFVTNKNNSQFLTTCSIKKHAVTSTENYRKDSCISRTFLLKFWAKNRGCGLYTRPFLSEKVNWLVVVTN